jgi:phosphoribosyl 1,2-cyclic phosphodiesterase
MSVTPALTVTYWGVTGSTPAPLRPAAVTDKIVAALGRLLDHPELPALRHAADRDAALRAWVAAQLPFALRSTYGGNTTCVEVRTPDALLIFDCGTGLHELGRDLLRRWRAADHRGPYAGHVFLSHAHLDHTCAFPFFDPWFDERAHFTFYGSAEVHRSFDGILAPTAALRKLFFPITTDWFRGLRERRTLAAGDTVTLGGTRVSTLALRHPGGCLGYRVDCGGRGFVFATDHEPAVTPDLGLAHFAHRADLLYLDGQFRAAEYQGALGVDGEEPQSRQGWGHGTVETCAALAVAAEVRRLHLGHREPKRDDADLARMEGELRAQLAQALRQAGRPEDDCAAAVAYEGLSVEL